VAQAILLARLLAWAMSIAPGPFPTANVVWLAVAFCLRSIVAGTAEIVAARTGRGVTSELRRRLFGTLDEAGPGWLATKKIGALALSATRGLRALEPYFSRYLPALVVGVLAPPLVLIVLGIIDWPSALIALGLVCVVPFFMVSLGRRAARESEHQWRRLASMSGRVLELLRGIPTLRALNAFDEGQHEVEAASESVARSINETLRAAMLSSAALEFLAGVGIGLVAMLAGLRLLHASISIAAALTVILLAPEVFLPLRRAGAEFHASTEGRAAAETIFSVLDEAPGYRGVSAGSSEFVALVPLTASDLTVTFDGSSSPALASCSFELLPGDQLVVTGPSGSGKSTLLHVIAGFIKPTSGSLLLDGVSEASLSTRSQEMSFVPQRPHVFSTSLRDNVTLGLAGSDAEVTDALERVGLGEWTRARGGLDAVLAERGRTISGGERQRIGIARALFQNRGVVLFDEPTAHLDAFSIAELRTSLAPWLAERTVIEVAHREGLLAGSVRRLELSGSEQ
jgi:ATP-binding cassette, subfamily C, bacterial CydCD